MSLSPGTKLGTYEILGPLGKGAMGEVYRAKDTKLGREVALKVLPAEFASDSGRLSRFSREAQLLASLNHPNIASIYGLEDSTGTRALIMELVEGATLADRIARGPLPLNEALPIARQIADALEYAHDRGIIHRDLKPANINITPDGNVKVLDFGLAKAMDFAPPTADLDNSPTISGPATRPGIILGTAAYMSPEQARGKSVDRRADIWSFGVVLFEMLAGRRPVCAETVSDLLAAIMKDEPDWKVLPSNLPPSVTVLLRRCLLKDPKQRLRDIGEARIALEKSISGAPEDSSASATVAPTSAQPAWRRVLPWSVVLLIVLFASALLWISYRSNPSASAQIARFSISLPPDQKIILSDTPILTVSRDGKNLVFAAQQGGVTQLFLRPLGELVAKPIAGTAGAIIPFFSPDGKWLAFFADQKLKKVSISGGDPVILCDAPNSHGGSWGADGNIIFSPDFASGLVRVSSNGGKPEPVTSLDINKGERTHRWPDILPNGEGVIFSIGAAKSPGNFELGEIAVLSFKTGKSHVLLEGANMSRYVPSGHILYTRSGVLYAAPFDANRLELKGEPMPVLSGVGGDVTSGAGYWAVSDDGTLINISRNILPSNQNLVLMNRNGQPTILPLPPRPYALPRFSPDGTRLAFRVGAGSGAENDIWTYDFASRALNRLTFGNYSGNPLWSPDGKRIAFQANHNGVSINIKASDGSAQEQVLVPPVNDTQLPDAWSPDGNWIVFVRMSPAQEMCLIPSDGHGQPKILVPDAGGPSFSPDGRWLAYASTTPRGEEVFVQAFPGPGGTWQVSQDGGTFPRWTKKGAELVYLKGEKMMAVDINTQGSFHSGSPHLLFELHQDRYYLRALPGVNYDVTSDGEKFIVVGNTAEAAMPPQMNVTLNWFADLRRLTSSQK